MKFHFSHSFPYQIELLPRLTISFTTPKLIMFEFLFFSVGFVKQSNYIIGDAKDTNTLDGTNWLFDYKLVSKNISTFTSK